MQWTNDQPIYQQVRDHVVSLIIDGVLKSGDPIPSVRQMAVEGGVNPLTVSKAYQELVDLSIVEKRTLVTPQVPWLFRKAHYSSYACFLLNNKLVKQPT